MHFSELKIQSTTHDSIEDARASLALYHEYLRMTREGVDIKELLSKMYQVGKKLNWKVPGDKDD